MIERTSTRSSSFTRLSGVLAVTLLTAGFLGLPAKNALANEKETLSAVHKQSDLGFSVLREGDAIGHHSIDFTRRGDDLVVDVNIDLEVKFAFITVYRYKHRNREIWRDGRLHAINTQTNDDGTEHWVKGTASAEGFTVDSDSGSALLPADVIPSSYWHPDTPQAKTLLNTQTGVLAEIDVATTEAKSPIFMPWGPQAAQSFEVSGDVDLNLWYDDKGCLLKMNFSAPGDGSLIDYVPTTHPMASGGSNLTGYPLIGNCTAQEHSNIKQAQH